MTLEVDASAAKPQSLNTQAHAPWAVFAVVLLVAAGLYAFRLGATALDDSEAYSAWAAGKPSVAAIIAIPVNDDPGKQVGYYTVAHFWIKAASASEAGIRSLSVIFAVLSVAVVFMLGREMFDDETAAAGAAMWAFAPLAVAFSRRARMYSIVIALALAHLLALWRTRERPGAGRAIAAGALGAALLYTHPGGILVVGAELVMLVRDFARARRTAMPWLALALALVLFLPMVPILRTQSRELVSGQWLDWIAPARTYPTAIKLAAIAFGAAAGLWIAFGGSIETRADEPLRWVTAWVVLPIVALETASIVIRPMFSLRYVAPTLAAGALMLAEVLKLSLGARVRNLAAAGFAAACLVLMPFAYPQAQHWREIAKMIAATGSSSDPVFFEAGYPSRGHAPNDGFPSGYFSVPFDRYFSGANPRVVVPGWDPDATRRAIEAREASASGGWLLSWKPEADAAAELPNAVRFRSSVRFRDIDLIVYRLEPATHTEPP